MAWSPIVVFTCTVPLLAGISSPWQARARSTVVYLRQVAWERPKARKYELDRRIENYTQTYSDPIAAETPMFYREQEMDPSVRPTFINLKWVDLHFWYKSRSARF